MSGVRSATTGGAGSGEGIDGARGGLEARGGELGRSVLIGFKLGVPGRGGASGSELSRLGACEVGGDEGGRRPSGSIAGAGAPAAAGAEGAAADGDTEAGVAAAGAADADFRATGGGGGVCELRAGGASTSSMSASASTSGPSLFVS